MFDYPNLSNNYNYYFKNKLFIGYNYHPESKLPIIKISEINEDEKPFFMDEVLDLETPAHYDNTKGTLYKVAKERKWNPYLFDIVKRLERAEKKGEFKTDLEKSITVIKLWLSESE